MTKGKVLILSGASSVGKGAIKKKLLADKDLALIESVSMTTRPKKANEEDGKDYYFVDYHFFANAVKNKDFLEYTEFNGYYYGTPKSQVNFLLSNGKNVLIEVEAEGVGPLKLNLPDALAVFIVPENMEELEKHIMDVQGDDLASANARINKARMEMEIAPLFKNQVKNTNIDEAVKEIKKLFMENNNDQQRRFFI